MAIQRDVRVIIKFHVISVILDDLFFPKPERCLKLIDFLLVLKCPH